MEKPKVKLKLEGLDGNAYALMGAFSDAARRQGWQKEEIDVILQDCMSDDYYHLISVLLANTEE